MVDGAVSTDPFARLRAAFPAGGCSMYDDAEGKVIIVVGRDVVGTGLTVDDAVTAATTRAARLAAIRPELWAQDAAEHDIVEWVGADPRRRLVVADADEGARFGPPGGQIVTAAQARAGAGDQTIEAFGVFDIAAVVRAMVYPFPFDGIPLGPCTWRDPRPVES